MLQFHFSTFQFQVLSSTFLVMDSEVQDIASYDSLTDTSHKRVRFHLPEANPEKMRHYSQTQQQPINKRGSRLSWLLRFSRRRPLTVLFVSTAAFAGSFPCMIFLAFVLAMFLVSFVVFVIAESSLVGAGLFALVLVLSLPLCCAAASTACLVACWWAVSYLQDSLSNMAEPAETAFHYFVGLYIPRRIRNILYAFYR